MRGRYLVTIGTFDGIHRGHQALMRWVIRRAGRSGLRTRVVLFDAPPRFYFHPESALPLLSTSAERKRRLKGLGIDQVEILRFGPHWAKMTHTRFFQDYLVGRWRAGGVLVGHDFHFGRGRKGGLKYLQSACRARGMSVGVLPLLRVAGKKISSSRIRHYLEHGDVRRAALGLGRPYAVSGKVRRGQGLGTKLGFPTANVAIPAHVMVPRGVYEVRVSGSIPRRTAACNVGVRPTVGGRDRVHVEVHIPGHHGPLYGRALTVEFIRRIRGERRFSSLESLRRRIAADIASLRR